MCFLIHTNKLKNSSVKKHRKTVYEPYLTKFEKYVKMCLLVVYTNRNAEAFGFKLNYCCYHLIISMCLSDLIQRVTGQFPHLLMWPLNNHNIAHKHCAVVFNQGQLFLSRFQAFHQQTWYRFSNPAPSEKSNNLITVEIQCISQRCPQKLPINQQNYSEEIWKIGMTISKVIVIMLFQ